MHSVCLFLEAGLWIFFQVDETQFKKKHVNVDGCSPCSVLDAGMTNDSLEDD